MPRAVAGALATAAAGLGLALLLAACGPPDVPREPFESVLSCDLSHAQLEELAASFEGRYFPPSMNHYGWTGIRRGRRHYLFDFGESGSLERVLVSKYMRFSGMYGREPIFGLPEELLVCRPPGSEGTDPAAAP